MEEAGNFSEAFLVYLKDASECVEQSSLVRAALSCSCAATCLAQMGHMSRARQLYLEAAMLYEENADLVIAKSIRESLWCLEEAHEYFLLASDRNRAERVFYKHVSLVTRVNPFQGEAIPLHKYVSPRVEGEEAIQLLCNKKQAIEVSHMTKSHLSEITKAIENFSLSTGKARTSTNSMSDSSTALDRKCKI